jgi:uncharacterized protein (DUF1684 family)
MGLIAFSSKKNMHLIVKYGALFGLLLLFSCQEDTERSLFEQSLIEDRLMKDEEFKADPNSPIPEHIRPHFKGLFYFEPDSSYQVTARLLPTDTTLYMRRNAKDSTRLYKAYRLEFLWKGKKHYLTAYWSDSTRESLFIPFRDSTSGNLTYGGGRFLDIPFRPADHKGTLVIDFNRCYNPYCAYNPEYACPLPPEENRLSFAVKAGEKAFEQLSAH